MTQARSLTFGGSSRTGLFVAGLLAAITGVLVFVILNSSDNGTSSARSFTGGSDTAVVTARRDIPARTKITNDMLEVSHIPSNSLLPGAFTASDLAAGRVAKIPIYKGEQLLQTKLADQATDLGLSYIVPEGQRAMAVKVDKVIGAGGLLRPGDRVDVVGVVDVKYHDIASDKEFTDTRAIVLAQNIEVLAVDQSLENQIPAAAGEKSSADANAPVDQPAADSKATVVTMALTPDVAQNVLLADAKGVIRLAVRAPGDSEIKPQNDSTFASIADPKFVQGVQDALRGKK